MKKIILVIALICLFIISQTAHAKSWTDNWTLNGIPLSKFKDADGKEYVQLGAGITTSFITHWIGPCYIF